jgi:hypothetical protein
MTADRKKSGKRRKEGASKIRDTISCSVLFWIDT